MGPQLIRLARAAYQTYGHHLLVLVLVLHVPCPCQSQRADASTHAERAQVNLLRWAATARRGQHLVLTAETGCSNLAWPHAFKDAV